VDLMIIIGVVVAALIVAEMIKRRAKPQKEVESFPFITRGRLFSNAERAFYSVLEQAVGARYRVFGKVRVADLISIRRDIDGKKRQSSFYKIQGNHVDYVLCEPTDMSVVCVIELEDGSHRNAYRAERDQYLDNAFRAASLPLIRFNASHRYSKSELISRLRQEKCITIDSA